MLRSINKAIDVPLSYLSSFYVYYLFYRREDFASPALPTKLAVSLTTSKRGPLSARGLEVLTLIPRIPSEEFDRNVLGEHLCSNM